LRNEDPLDLARTAHVSATSHSAVEKFNLKRGIEGDLLVLDKTYCVIFPVKPGGNSKTSLELYLQNQGPDTKLETVWVGMDMDSRQIRAEAANEAEAASVNVPAKFDGYVTIPRTRELSGSTGGIQLKTNPQIYVRKLEFADHGVYLAVQNPPYWMAARYSSFVHRFSDDPLPPPANTLPDNVINGVARPISADNYAWVSDPAQGLPQDITLHFNPGSDVYVSRLQLVFDSDLRNPSLSFLSVPVVRQLVKDYDILLDGVTVLKARDNNLHFRRHSLLDDQGRAVKASKLTVRVLTTYGDPSARIFEIRVY
jgi:hypothetical protein